MQPSVSTPAAPETPPMQNKPGPGFWSLCAAFFWRWVLASSLAWLIGLMLWFVLTIILAVGIAAASGVSGNATPKEFEGPIKLAAGYAAVPVFVFFVPIIAALGAFVWLYFSPEFRRVTQSAGPAAHPTPSGAPASARPSDPYTQYTQAYQRWQLQYAQFIQSQKPAPQPAPEPPSQPTPQALPDTPLPATPTPPSA